MALALALPLYVEHVNSLPRWGWDLQVYAATLSTLSKWPFPTPLPAQANITQFFDGMGLDGWRSILPSALDNYYVR